MRNNAPGTVLPVRMIYKDSSAEEGSRRQVTLCPERLWSRR